jgi:23S rRNA (adenine2503-C2)-methyltransferase
METTRQNLLGLTEEELCSLAVSGGGPRYRGKQVFGWLYAKAARDFQQMTDLGKSFRKQLSTVATIQAPLLVTQQCSSRDGTTKFLFELSDGLRVESVLIPPSSAFRSPEAAQEDEQRRLTICISTQVGCPLDCKFCATASMGYLRNLTAGEIVGQILEVKRQTGRKITNVVFMGMGEPMMNYDNVMKSVEIIVRGIGIAARRVTISTAGWAERIRQMGDEKRRAKLAISLHSAINETRTALMPINKRYNLDQLSSAIEYYYARTKQRVTYEYIFFDGINDSEKDIAALVKFARRVPSKINVIPFHPISCTSPQGVSASLRPSPRLEENVERLRKSNLTVFLRSSAGEDITAACGQLAVNTGSRRRVDRSNISLLTPA